jgi:NADPH:quinone reductase
MKAIIHDIYGEADVLRLEEIDRPEPGDDEVLLRVHAAGVDRGVWHIMAGLPYPIRLAGYGFRVPKDRVRGREVAGRVEAVGNNVTTLKPGDDAYGIAEGSFAEYAVGRADKLAPKPTNLTFEQAAATTISALTALQAVRDGGHVESGQKVLIIGASGGVGTFAVQIAKAFGAEVTGVARTSKLEMVRSAGADHVIDYTRQDVAAEVRAIAPGGVNTVVEVSPAVNAELDAAVLARHGSVAVYADNGGRAMELPVRPSMVPNARWQFVYVYNAPETWRGRALEDVAGAVLDGAVRVGDEAGLPLHHYSLDQAAEAHAAVEGGVVGKVLIDVV